jgi:hypothetical protein
VPPPLRSLMGLLTGRRIGERHDPFFGAVCVGDGGGLKLSVRSASCVTPLDIQRGTQPMSPRALSTSKGSQKVPRRSRLHASLWLFDRTIPSSAIISENAQGVIMEADSQKGFVLVLLGKKSHGQMGIGKGKAAAAPRCAVSSVSPQNSRLRGRSEQM